jgi:hypothetical protein
MTKFEAKWHSGPPPHVGWWNASVGCDPEVWRWWNGWRWSLPATPITSPLSARNAATMSASQPTNLCIQWRHYYPANARVPRINPNIKGDKS